MRQRAFGIWCLTLRWLLSEPSEVTSARFRTVSSQGMLGWSQAIQASCLPSGLNRGADTKSLPPANTAISPLSRSAMQAASDSSAWHWGRQLLLRCRLQLLHNLIVSMCAPQVWSCMRGGQLSQLSDYKQHVVSHSRGNAAVQTTADHSRCHHAAKVSLSTLKWCFLMGATCLTSA